MIVSLNIRKSAFNQIKLYALMQKQNYFFYHSMRN
jgi:hypothetical protein